MWTVRFVTTSGGRAGSTEERYETKREAHEAIRRFNSFKSVCRIGHLYIVAKSSSKF